MLSWRVSKPFFLADEENNKQKVVFYMLKRNLVWRCASA
jgi:hypothetical protein